MIWNWGRLHPHRRPGTRAATPPDREFGGRIARRLPLFLGGIQHDDLEETVVAREGVRVYNLAIATGRYRR